MSDRSSNSRSAAVIGWDRQMALILFLVLAFMTAPEMKQACKNSKGRKQLCGQLAKQSLEKLVQSQDVRCKGDKRDRYKRLIAICYVGPFNINEQMVVAGWALAYRKYSKGYVREENLAKARREGM